MLSNTFYEGATLESVGDTAVHNKLKVTKEVEESNINYNSTGPSLAEVLQQRRELEEEEEREKHRHMPPKAIDDEEYAFLQAIDTQEQLRIEFLHQQSTEDSNAFNVQYIHDIVKYRFSNAFGRKQ